MLPQCSHLPKRRQTDGKRRLPGKGRGGAIRYPPESGQKEADSARNTISLRLTTEDGTVIEYALNDSQAAADLYSQLPRTIEVEDYSTNEKIFYPPEELDTGDAPEAAGGAGVLAYYEPWGDVVMFYDDFSTASGLYELGTVTSGSENISELSGSVRIEQAE